MLDLMSDTSIHVGSGTPIRSLECSMAVELRPIESLVGTEEVDSLAVERLAREIRSRGEWVAPIPIECHLGLVMDGNHRLEAAKLLGLIRVPCCPLSYYDGRVSVACWESETPFPVERIVAIAIHRRLLPYKSTRHRFEPNLPTVAIRLAELLAAA